VVRGAAACRNRLSYGSGMTKKIETRLILYDYMPRSVHWSAASLFHDFFMHLVVSAR
jgi:hypothetical protein